MNLRTATQKELKKLTGVCTYPSKMVDGKLKPCGVGTWESGGIKIIQGSAKFHLNEDKISVITESGGPACLEAGRVLEIPVDLVAFVTSS